jgi:hypothetical protein
MLARRDWTGLLAALLLAGCATVADDAPVATFDELTGESLLHPALPTTLHAERPGLSVIGKDYLALSPVTVSGRGAPVTYLWCSLSSSIDRAITGAPAPDIDAIVLLVDDVPMALNLEPWAKAATALPFDERHGPGIAFAARVTASQLGKIVAARELAAYVVEAGSHSPRFTVAEDTRADWASF